MAQGGAVWFNAQGLNSPKIAGSNPAPAISEVTTMSGYQPSYDEDGNLINDPSETKKSPAKIEVDGEKFITLYRMYNTIDKRGKRILSKTRFARELGVSYQTLNTILKELIRDGNLDQRFKDDAILAIRKHEAVDTPKNILERMGIMRWQ